MLAQFLLQAEVHSMLKTVTTHPFDIACLLSPRTPSRRTTTDNSTVHWRSAPITTSYKRYSQRIRQRFENIKARTYADANTRQIRLISCRNHAISAMIYECISTAMTTPIQVWHVWKENRAKRCNAIGCPLFFFADRRKARKFEFSWIGKVSSTERHLCAMRPSTQNCTFWKF